MRPFWAIKVLIVAFAAYLGLLGADLMLRPDIVFSEQENRYLEQRPDFSWQELVSGRYGRQLELWMTDQIAGRDRWVGYKAELMRSLGFKDNRGIYFGQDGYLFQRFVLPSDQALQETIAGILHLQQLMPHIPVTFLLAPTSSAIYPDKLPNLSITDDQAAFIRQVREQLGDVVFFVDVLPALNEKSAESIYYRTDHHWTMRGAFYAWQAWQTQAGKPVPLWSDYLSEVVSESFYGTSWSRAGLYSLKPDFIEVIQPKKTVPLTMTYGHRVRDSLFNDTFLERKDKYSYFLDGNQPLVVIDTERDQATDDQRRVLVIKNSYANCLIPLMVNAYDAIHVVDLRHNQTNLALYAQEQGITEILYLYDVIGFSSDRHLRLLKRTAAAS